jgi:cbb3-type cytochrome oxidase subunit 3
MSMGLAHGLWSLAVLGVFIAVVIWVWSGGRRSHFEEAGRIPFREGGAAPDGKDGP